jgi:hypothetical protein
VEIYTHNTSTYRSSNLAPFDKISKSGDAEGSGDIFTILKGVKLEKTWIKTRERIVRNLDNLS